LFFLFLGFKRFGLITVSKIDLEPVDGESQTCHEIPDNGLSVHIVTFPEGVAIQGQVSQDICPVNTGKHMGPILWKGLKEPGSLLSNGVKVIRSEKVIVFKVQGECLEILGLGLLSHGHLRHKIHET
jgi:hypothetical protein